MNETLLAPTPERWFEVAAERWQDLLTDHANCEKKAASTALSLIFTYSDDRPLADSMSRLAREELRHFEQVQKLMVQLNVPFQRMSPARYAEGMRKAMRREEPGRLIDLLVCGALIEARSCERFRRLAPRLATPLKEFYGARHCAVSLKSKRNLLRLPIHSSVFILDCQVNHSRLNRFLCLGQVKHNYLCFLAGSEFNGLHIYQL